MRIHRPVQPYFAWLGPLALLCALLLGQATGFVHDLGHGVHRAPDVGAAVVSAGSGGWSLDHDEGDAVCHALDQLGHAPALTVSATVQVSAWTAPAPLVRSQRGPFRRSLRAYLARAPPRAALA